MTIDPEISVVICTYNRDKFIRKSLECLAGQTLDRRLYEIIVVDNNSTDATAAIVKGFMDVSQQLNIRYVFEKNKGLSFARNRGLKEARAEIITYVDDDAEAVPDFLMSIQSFFQSHRDAAGAGGKVIPVYPDGREPPWMNRYLNGFAGKVEHGDRILLYDNSMKYPAGCNMTYQKSILEKAGGFNNQLTFRSDDKYIFYKVRELSEKIYYLPKAIVFHHIDAHRLTFGNFKKLYLKTGNEEKIRIRTEGNSFAPLKKLIELAAKFGASLLLYCVFLLRGKEIKGRYLVFSQWFTLKGFLLKKVFVR